MKKLIFICASLMIGAAAEAGQLNCSGSYFGYNFNARASTSGQRISSRITVSITSSSGMRQSSQLVATSSDIQAGRYVRFSGSGPDGSGSLEANYDSSQQLYFGTLVAQTSAGNANVPVSCSLTGALRDVEQVPN